MCKYSLTTGFNSSGSNYPRQHGKPEPSIVDKGVSVSWSREPGRYRGVPQPLAERIRYRDRWTCQKCGDPGNEVDHIENVAAGGSDDEANLWVLCTQCHRIKTASEAAAGRARRSRKRSGLLHPGLRQTGAVAPSPR
ncbi:HNH endonuclease [Nocardia sp. NPDC052566]|uniref:HNH endonuclease n=1 Tax=Nocardia sp. NPDC052566 TaxID=3364330 RepID=UPI0037C6EA2E